MPEPIAEIHELIAQGLAKKKKLVGTHFACPDGLLSCVEFFRIVGNMDDYHIIPMEYKFLLDKTLEQELNGLTFEAILDFGTMGKHIKYFADHHRTNIGITDTYVREKRIEVNCFDADAPSGVSVVDVLGKKMWKKGVPQTILEPANRSDTATFTTESPCSWKEFHSGDVAWQYALLTRTTRDSPKEFVKLCRLLYEKPLSAVVEMEPYRSRLVEDLEKNAKTKQIAESIKPEEVTLVISTDGTKAKYLTRQLMFRLYDGHCKVVALIAAHETYYKASFGVEVGMPEEGLEPWRVDKLAEQIGKPMKSGGGHKRASAAIFEKSEKALKDVIRQIEEKFSSAKVKIVYV